MAHSILVAGEVAANPANEMAPPLDFHIEVGDLLAGSRRIIYMQIRSVGIDLGETTFAS